LAATNSYPESDYSTAFLILIFIIVLVSYLHIAFASLPFFASFISRSLIILI